MDKQTNNTEVLKNPVMSRRKALGLMAAVSVSPTAVVGGVLADPVFTKSRLQTLFHEHASAVETDTQAWNAVGDIIDYPLMKTHQIEQVVVGTLHRGTDSEGNAILEPIGAFSNEEIEKKYRENLRVTLSFIKPSATDLRKEAVAKFERQIAEKCAELAAIKAKNQQINDASGYTVAQAAARVTREAVREIESAVLQYVPQTMAEVGQQANWILEACNDDEHSYLYERTDVLETFLASLSKAAGVSA